MKIFPAIDLYGGRAVRLYKGEYDKMTDYGDPLTIAGDFVSCGAKYIHVVDLEGARSGETPNLSTVLRIKEKSDLFCEIGGGVRNMDVVKTYLEAGIDRVILGTAAVADERFLRNAVDRYGDRIAVGADSKDGYIAVKGWTEKSAFTVDEFFAKMQSIGVKTIICTDVSKDGAMQGTNRKLYADLQKKFCVDITASGGVSSLEDVVCLKQNGLYGAIIGKAYYTGTIDLKRAVEVAE